MAELRIPIIGEFKGKKAFGDAEKATGKLDKGVKKLAGTLLAAFSVQKIVSFGKNAVKAFAENEKSAKRLETVVKNLGLAFELPGIEASLDKVSAKFGYEGEVLREAFQKLITTTGSAKKSQDLLNLSLDIAAGSGVDLLTVNQDLAAAYVGQTRGLRKYNLGLSQSELKTLDFDSAVSKLTNNFKGAGTAELETYSGKMRVLQEAADNAQEIIGKSLVESLSLLAGEGNTIEPLATAMADFATYIGDAIYGVAVLTEKLKGIPGASLLGKAGGFRRFMSLMPGGGLLDALDALSKLGAESRPTAGMGGYPSSALGGTFVDPIEAARKKAEREAAKREKDRIKREKELAALAKKNLDAQRKALALSKASKTLDLERIGIEAALKGEISKTDRLSLNLQLALLDENDAAATKLSGQLDAAIKRQNELAALLLATPKAPNPYEHWKVPKLDFGGNLLGSLVPNFTAPSYTNPYTPDAGFLAGISGQKQPVINIEVIVDGEAVGGAVRDSSVNSSLSGSFNTVNRAGRFAEFAIE
jgi:hypothetical protein